MLSLLDSKTKHLVTGIGKNGIFYAIELKSLKEKFEKPNAVADLRCNEISGLPKISVDVSKGLRHFH